MTVTLTPSIVRCQGTIEERAHLVNELNCERVHVDLALGLDFPVLLTLESFGMRERGYFQSAVDLHVFSFVEVRELSKLPLKSGDRLIVHYLPGTQKIPLSLLRRKAREQGAEFGLCVGLDVPFDRLARIVKEKDLLMILAIPIGGSGLPLDARTLPLLKKLRDSIANPRGCTLGIDGGVNEWSFGALCSYVDVVVLGGLLLNTSDLKQRWKELSLLADRIPNGKERRSHELP
jgi:pentose-5-phosphate-3-epimerase